MVAVLFTAIKELVNHGVAVVVVLQVVTEEICIEERSPRTDFVSSIRSSKCAFGAGSSLSCASQDSKTRSQFLP